MALYKLTYSLRTCASWRQHRRKWWRRWPAEGHSPPQPRYGHPASPLHRSSCFAAPPEQILLWCSLKNAGESWKSADEMNEVTGQWITTTAMLLYYWECFIFSNPVINDWYIIWSLSDLDTMWVVTHACLPQQHTSFCVHGGDSVDDGGVPSTRGSCDAQEVPWGGQITYAKVGGVTGHMGVQRCPTPRSRSLGGITPQLHLQ